MIHENFAVLGFGLSSIGAIIYIRGIQSGKVKPNLVTWVLWATAPMLAFAAQFSEGVGMRSLLTFGAGFFPLCIIVAALIKRNAFVALKRTDYVYGALSILGLVLWQITGEGIIAICFGIAADGLAAAPTIMKLYNEPETENGNIFGFGVIAAILTLLTIDDWRFEEYSFAAYLLLVNSIMFYPSGKKLTQSILKLKDSSI